ncbi:MAG: hypothetical protein U0837_14280 [Dehalococcoidia bacterium]
MRGFEIAQRDGGVAGPDAVGTGGIDQDYAAFEKRVREAHLDGPGCARCAPAFGDEFGQLGKGMLPRAFPVLTVGPGEDTGCLAVAEYGERGCRNIVIDGSGFFA